MNGVYTSAFHYNGFFFQVKMAAPEKESSTIPNGTAGESHPKAAASHQHNTGSKKLSLPIQTVVHEYHMKHGLRHQDFFRFEKKTS